MILNRNFWPLFGLRTSLPKVFDFVLFSSGYRHPNTICLQKSLPPLHPNTICLQKNLPPQHTGVSPALQPLCSHTLQDEGRMELRAQCALPEDLPLWVWV